MPLAVRTRLSAPLLWALLLACACACLAISSQSLWVDEAQTALKATPDTLHGWWRTLDGEGSSNMQLPLYMLYIWGWARIFGISEIALRAANLPWFILGLIAIFHFLRRHPPLRAATLLLYSLHPFVWYYLDEARPYIMQLSGALLVSGALFAALDEPGQSAQPLPSSWWWAFGAGLFILCGAGLLGVPWAIGPFLLLLSLPAFRRSITRSGLPALALFLPLLTLLALYFLWTVEKNVHASPIAMTLPSMLSTFYEQLGFLGLGPGRLDLRSNSVAATRPFLLPLALLGIPLVLGLIFAASRRFGLGARRILPVLILAVSPILLIFALGFLRDTRILARHLTPLFPFILLAQAFTLLLLWNTRNLLGRLAASLILIALACSSLEVRFAPRHAREDYRAAAAAARESLAQGKIVWWSSDIEGAIYYHLPLDPAELPGVARQLYGVPAHFTAPPDEIFVSRSDILDPAGTVPAFTAAHHYRQVAAWQGVTLWQKPSS
jgi:hypothetical protein